MNVSNQFDQRSQTILIDGELRRSESSEGRDMIDPATANVIGRLAETGSREAAWPEAD